MQRRFNVGAGWVCCFVFMLKKNWTGKALVLVGWACIVFIFHFFSCYYWKTIMKDVIKKINKHFLFLSFLNVCKVLDLNPEFLKAIKLLKHWLHFVMLPLKKTKCSIKNILTNRPIIMLSVWILLCFVWKFSWFLPKIWFWKYKGKSIDT